MTKYTVLKSESTFALIRSDAPLPGHEAPQETEIASGQLHDLKSYKAACEMTALANITTALNHAISEAEEVLDSDSPESFL